MKMELTTNSPMPIRSPHHRIANKLSRSGARCSRKTARVLATAFFVLLLPPFMWAQQDAAQLLSAACGPDSTKFEVQRQDTHQSSLGVLDSKSRLIIFAESFGTLSGCGPVRIGMDGKWIGALCLGPWLAADVQSGVHHLCADFHWRPAGRHLGLEGFTAEPGKTYYFRAEVVDSFDMNAAVHLDPLNEDEGQYLLATQKQSESKEK